MGRPAFIYLLRLSRISTRTQPAKETVINHKSVKYQPAPDRHMQTHGQMCRVYKHLREPACMYAEQCFQQLFMHKLSFLESLLESLGAAEVEKFIMMHLDHFMNTFIQQEQKENVHYFCSMRHWAGPKYRFKY